MIEHKPGCRINNIAFTTCDCREEAEKIEEYKCYFENCSAKQGADMFWGRNLCFWHYFALNPQEKKHYRDWFRKVGN